MNTNLNKNIMCLFLIGGKSSRLRFNKFDIKYNYSSYWKYCYKILNIYFKTYLSLSSYNKKFFYFKNFNFLLDIFSNSFGPISGILTSLKFNNHVSWFIISCDFVFLNRKFLDFFLEKRNLNFDVNVLFTKEGVEPLFSIYEVSSYKKIFNFFLNGCNCLKTFISSVNTNYIKIEEKFFNVNNYNDLNFFFIKQVRVKVLYFSFFKDYSLKDFEYFYFLYENDLLNLFYLIIKKYNLTININYVKCIVNNKIEFFNYKINNKDIIFFLLPVSGG